MLRTTVGHSVISTEYVVDIQKYSITTGTNSTQVEKTGASLYHGGLIEGSPENLRISRQHDTEGLQD